MSRLTKKTKCLLALGMALAVLLFLFVSAIQYAQDISYQGRCTTNLRQISLAAVMYLDDHDSYPANLQSITIYCTNRNWLVCPATGHKPGPMSNVLQWTDYVIVPRTWVPNTDLRLVMAYCIPEHHHNRYGQVAHMEGSVSRIPAKEFWSQVKSAQQQ